MRIYASDLQSLQAAVNRVEEITAEAEIGSTRGGWRKWSISALFVNILPGKDGLLHISQIAAERVETVTDYLQEGQVVDVVVLDVDQRGRIKLTMKEVPNYTQKTA